jgi:DNA-binding SARP family transcriptional activator
VEFRILGPLEVVHDGVRIEPSGNKPRALLALLLLSANRVVPVDRLIDDLWEGRPPLSAMTTLQTYVSQLRRLGVTGLRTLRCGYVLEVEAGTLDAQRFERVLAAMREHGDDVELVAARLTEALGWWRGPALVDFADSAWAQLEATRLESLRLDALGDCFDARLALGHHRALVTEVQTLVAEHAFYERFWAQLMLALYRSDRQADALRAYQQLRRHLGEELGIPPSTELVRLEEAILLQDPELEWCAPRCTAHSRNFAEPQPRPGAVVALVDDDDDASASPGAWLALTRDGVADRLPLYGDRISIGRSCSNDVPLVSSLEVSRFHALLERVGSGWFVRDLGSRNGTFLDGARVERSSALRDGDCIGIGGWRAVFRDDSETDSAITEQLTPVAM